jgi:hypothetical protein
MNLEDLIHCPPSQTTQDTSASYNSQPLTVGIYQLLVCPNEATQTVTAKVIDLGQVDRQASEARSQCLVEADTQLRDGATVNIANGC